MKRVLIIGSPGAGKSTFATQLAEKTNLPLIHLDREFWQPGWVQTPADEWRQKVADLTTGENWIIDGSYDGSLDIRLPRADTVIFLDFPRYLCLWRITKRIFTGFGKVRSDMADGCPEQLDIGFFKWAWNYHRDHYPQIQEKLKDFFSDGKLIVLKNPAEVSAFLSS
jgi:adenylate kinase family enzyme